MSFKNSNAMRLNLSTSVKIIQQSPQVGKSKYCALLRQLEIKLNCKHLPIATAKNAGKTAIAISDKGQRQIRMRLGY